MKGIAMLKLVTLGALGALGYAAYRYFEKNGKLPNLNELVDTVKSEVGMQPSTDGRAPN
jgi:hypothetical protein